MATISVLGPLGTFVDSAYLDSAADDTVIREDVAAKIGIDLTNAPEGTAAGPGMALVLLRNAEVTLRLTDGKEQREWQARVGFTSARLSRPLLGFAGCLQFFTCTFHGDREVAELTVNGLYPGR
jgi:hypothetical protein